MADTTPIHLCIADPSANQAEELISLLRNSGYPVRAAHAVDADAVAAALAAGPCDLVLCRSGADGCDVAVVAAAVRGQDRHIPLLLLEDQRDPDLLTAGMALGADDVLLDDDGQRLLLVLERELRALRAARGQQRAEVALRESERRCDLLLETSKAAIAYVHEGMHIFSNSAYVALFGFAEEDDLVAVPLLDLIDGDSQAALRDAMRHFEGDTPSTDGAEPLAITGRKDDGSTFAATVHLSPATYDDERCLQVLIREQEVAPKPSLSGRIEAVQTLDPLTGLFTRPHFISEVDQRMKAPEAAEAVLFYVQLDDFGKVRSELGIGGADSVVAEVSAVLRGQVGGKAIGSRFSDDVLTFARSDIDRDAAEAMAEAMRKAVEDHLIEAEGRTVQVTVSIGVAPLKGSGDTAQAVLSNALRMAGQVRGDDDSGNGWRYYDVSTEAKRQREQRIRAGGDDALLALVQQHIEQSSFVLMFQPIISLRGDDDEHYEVFLRMPDAEGNLMRPEQFIEAACDAGVGETLDRWVAASAIKALVQHRAKGHDTRLTINVSRSAVTDAGFVPWLAKTLKAARLPADALIFQLGEQDATTYLKPAREFSNGIRDLHCRCSVSHFGVSVNPFGTLRHLSVDFVKLDGSWVKKLENAETADEFTKLLKSLQGQGKLTVVPMVETAAVLASLWQAGANYIQGQYLQEPTLVMDYDFSNDD